MKRLFLGALLALFAVGLIYRFRLYLIPGITITSWWRTPWHNEEVGGVPNSRHQLGLAFDIVPVTNEVKTQVAALGFSKMIDEGSHIHVEII